MENKTMPLTSRDHAGVYVPPPLIYVSLFFVSILCQRAIPLPYGWLKSPGAQIIGGVFIMSGITFLLPSLWRFLVSRNTLITIKPAHSLQTTGIYSFSRNPMYLALLCLYLGIAIFKGNLWTIAMVPVIVVIIQTYVIKKEEHYLIRAFGNEYLDYMKRVRRWL
ncbi:MAG: isoprenylcysteine carboxylmethyltransferase family protein [Chryseolinea sp.]